MTQGDIMKESEIVELLNKNEPFIGLDDISITNIKWRKWNPLINRISTDPDISFQINFNGKLISVNGEIKIQVTPKMLEQLGPWLNRIKLYKPNDLWVLICPYLSPESQNFCQENAIDFIDLSGNILLRKPGEIYIERLNQPNLYKRYQLFRKPFGGASSRVVRILLENPKKLWSITEIFNDIVKEEQRFNIFFNNIETVLTISISSISKVIKSLEEKLLIRRQGLSILVSDPSQLLSQWADKYRENYKNYLKGAIKSNNPLGFTPESTLKKLPLVMSDMKVLLTGSAAASMIAPFVNIDRIDLFDISNSSEDASKELNLEKSIGPELLFIDPYDAGVALFFREINGVAVVSDIQVFLDCFARGGRDAKQAEYIFENVIKKRWEV
jgi:hypothetical protein